MTEHYDLIVIGSGAGGGTLTHALAPTGKRILLLERGDFLPREPENWDSKSVWVDLRYRNPGKWTDADTAMEFTPKQHYYVGGNTKFYGAILFRFRERDFGQVQHVDGVSPAWPVSYTDFEPYYTRAEQLYHVHGQHGSDPDDPPTAATYRYPPLSHEPRIAQLEADLARTGLHPFPLPVGLIYDEAAPQFSPCIRCATCDGYPCLVNGKADAHVVCVAPALRYPNVTLRTRTRVVRLETDASGGAVTQVVAERDGQTDRYSADIVVVSAGAINSAALLLASASERHPDGLGISAVAHQNGTIRFGTDPATSALDLNCKLYDLDNVYVVDASFFVSATAVNPTLTIVANALRVADHLAQRLGAPPAHQGAPVPVAVGATRDA